MTQASYIIAAKRTAVAPRGGVFSMHSAVDLGKFALLAALQEVDLPVSSVEHCIFANALYGGGNPTRVSALAADIPEAVPSLTIDTQCCGGLDAILMANQMITAGAHDLVIAGGIESFSTAPRRFARSLDGTPDVEYTRPAFSPWSDRDPDMLEAAGKLAHDMTISRQEQELFAQLSHAKALAAQSRLQSEIVPVASCIRDEFTRKLQLGAVRKLPIIAGHGLYGITAATTAVEADSSAVCLLASQDFLNAHPKLKAQAVQIVGGLSVGSDPAMPALAPVPAVERTLERLSLSVHDFDVLEMMEAFACQAMACMKICDFDPAVTNIGGGGLARGHPIGASGAINAVRLFHELRVDPQARKGLATIAGAGGLGSTLVVSK